MNVNKARLSCENNFCLLNSNCNVKNIVEGIVNIQMNAMGITMKSSTFIDKLVGSGSTPYNGSRPNLRTPIITKVVQYSNGVNGR